MIFDDTERIQIADISHHQGFPPRFPVVDFRKMKAWGFVGCVMRASHGPFADRAFTYNWPACKGILPRASYHYYENWVEPGTQAQKYWSMIEHDPEGIAILDLEDRLNGDFSHWDDWYQWLERFKSLSGFTDDRIGIYSGFSYLKEAFATMPAGTREYFTQYRLWYAFGYSDWNPLEPDFSKVRLPAPYTDADVLAIQCGTPVIGKAAGVYSEELDYNRVNGRMNFIRMFGGDAPQPEPEEPTMAIGQGRVIRLTNIRNSPPDGGPYNDIGDLHEGDIVTWDRAPLVNGVIWYHLTDARRGNQPIITLGGLTVSQRQDCWAYGVNIEPMQPTPAPAGLPAYFIVRDPSGNEARYNKQ